jgi:hypothetical protein
MLENREETLAGPDLKCPLRFLALTITEMRCQILVQFLNIKQIS